MSHPATPSRFIGCDVGKTAIVVFDTASGATRAIANEPQALSDFAASLEAACFVVCEATGGYERDLLAALIAAGVPACRADARKVKAFIRSFGTLGKSDAIDATALARYGRDRYAELPLWSAREPERERLQALVLARRDLVKNRLAYANRRTAPAAEPVRPYLDTLVESFDAQINAIEADIKTLCAACEPIAKAVNVLVAIPGVGQKTAAALIALMPELGSLPRRQAAALAGLAPIPIKAARPTPIAEPAAEDPKSNESSSWPQSPPQNTTPPSAPSTNVCSAQVKSPSSPSPQSCENSSSSQTPNSDQIKPPSSELMTTVVQPDRVWLVSCWKMMIFVSP
jgi:transposase